MKHTNIIAALNGSVWLTSEDKFNEIMLFAEQIANGVKLEYPESGEREVPYTRIEDGVAVVRVYGTLTKRANLLTKFSGGTSTDILEQTFNALMVDDRVKSVVLDVDSPGGEAKGTYYPAVALRALAAKKPVYTVVNELMASGAYWIGSAARRIFVTPTAETGSIGVYMLHQDLSGRLSEEKVKYTVIRAGKYKIVPNPVEPLTETGIKLLQEKVDKYYNLFVDSIASNRRIDIKTATELADGRTYIGDDAIAVGLADDVASLDEVIQMAKENKFGTWSFVSASAQLQNGSVVEKDVSMSAEAVQSEVAPEDAPVSVASMWSVTEVPGQVTLNIEAFDAATELAEDEAVAADAGIDVDELIEANESLAADLANARAELENLKAELLITEFSAKLPPADKEGRARWIERAKADPEGTKALLRDLPNAVPTGAVVTPQAAEKVPVPNGYLVATNEIEAQVYEDLGVKFVRQF